MKIAIKLKQTKPRNPLVAPARNRKAGAHGGHNPTRHARRVDKHKLRLFLMGRITEENHDA